MKRLAALAAVLATALIVAPQGEAQATRNYVWAAGSSTVFPFTTRVAENFQRRSGGPAPQVEALGTGGGIRAFCSGIGASTPDIANASRQMLPSEFDECRRNGVTDIIELQIGYDGIVIATARNGADFDFQLEHLYLGLAREVLRGREIVRNPYTSWDQIGGLSMPGTRIQVYGPPPTSGTRDSWLELGMEAGARSERFPTLQALRASDGARFTAISHTLREDGAWIDAGENDNAIVQTLTRTPGALGVFGFSFLAQNREVVKAATINGVAPSLETIASGEYPISRSMFIYVKAQHIGVIPGLAEFVDEYMSDASAGAGGYLQDRGIVPMLPGMLTEMQGRARSRTVMARPSSN